MTNSFARRMPAVISSPIFIFVILGVLIFYFLSLGSRRFAVTSERIVPVSRDRMNLRKLNINGLAAEPSAQM